jgi:hypothetical protein
MATKKGPGGLTWRAKKAGMSLLKFARAHQHQATIAGEESRYYLNVLRPAILARLAKRG